MKNIKKQIKSNDFEKLINNVHQTHCLLQENSVKVINCNLTVRNWIVGYYIVEYEQEGNDRAQYGTKLLEEMAKELKGKEIKGLPLRTLRNCRTFYLTYPQIRQTLFAEFERLFSELNHFPSNNEIPIRQTVSAELEEENYPLSPYQLLSRLSFSHFVELIQVEDNLQRLFYEVETIKNNWSVRELARAVDTSLALRTSLSTNKEAIIKKIKNLKPTSTNEIMRNPIVMEFLDMEEKSEYSETDLETAILNHLQKFLMELGTGFCFEARQKRITFDNEHYRIDLVFYHRILKSHILIDLKVGKFDHADAGQMNVYLNYYKENEMCDGDNPPVGLILCGNKKEALARYATTCIDNQMFVTQYLLKLPDKKLLESFIKNEIQKNE